jgi:hypothetical protein
MAKHIKDIEKMYDLLKQWQNVASRLNNDGIVMIKEMATLNMQTQILLGDEDDK